MTTVKREGGVRKGRGRTGKARAAEVEGLTQVPMAEGEGFAQPQAPATAQQQAHGLADEGEGVVSVEDAGLAQLASIETEGLSPLGYLLRVMRDEGETPARRMDAAKTAAPFLHPKLATMDVQSAGLDRMGDALLELIERAQGDGGGVGGLLGR